MTFDSLSKALNGKFDKPLKKLPAKLRLRIEAVFPLPWDELLLDQRYSVAEQWDYWHDPANESEQKYLFDLSVRMLEKEKEIEECSAIPPTTVTERVQKKTLLAELQRELAVMKKEDQQQLPHGNPTKSGTIGAGQGESENPCSVFRAMNKLTADEVSIAFVGDKTESGMGANNMLNISARGKTSLVALAALDLVDRRRGELNSQGAILLGMAQKKTLTRSESKAKIMSRLREVFQIHLGISGDPFHPYRKATGWEPCFKIYDNRGAADERAKREAERHTISYDQTIESGEKASDTNQTHQSFDSENDATGDWLKNNDPNAPA